MPCLTVEKCLFMTETANTESYLFSLHRQMLTTCFATKIMPIYNIDSMKRLKIVANICLSGL